MWCRAMQAWCRTQLKPLWRDGSDVTLFIKFAAMQTVRAEVFELVHAYVGNSAAANAFADEFFRFVSGGFAGVRHYSTALGLSMSCVALHSWTIQSFAGWGGMTSPCILFAVCIGVDAVRAAGI